MDRRKNRLLLVAAVWGPLVPPSIWAHETLSAPNSVLLALCDRSYEADDYIRNYAEFAAIRKKPCPVRYRTRLHHEDSRYRRDRSYPGRVSCATCPRGFPLRKSSMIDNMMTQRFASLFNLPGNGRFRFIEGDVTKMDLRPIFDGAHVVLPFGRDHRRGRQFR